MINIVPIFKELYLKKVTILDVHKFGKIFLFLLKDSLVERCKDFSGTTGVIYEFNIVRKS